MVINANTKTATKVLMVSFVGAKYGRISQISRRKTGISFLNTRRAPSRGTRTIRDDKSRMDRGGVQFPIGLSSARALGPFRLATRHFKTGCAWL
jgi:hypothetical protein